MLCLKCKELISASARRCPECGYALKPSWKLLIVGVMLIFSLATVFFLPYLIKFIKDEPKPKPDNSQTATTKAIQQLFVPLELALSMSTYFGLADFSCMFDAIS